MNRKQLLILLALVAVLGGVGLTLTRNHNQSWAQSDTKQGRKLLENFPINDVAQMRLVGESELNLVKKDDQWRVRERDDYPANFEMIRGFLVKLGDLKITQSEPVEPSQLADLSLVEPKPGEKPGPKTATLIELKDKDGKLMRAILLGVKHTRKMNSPYGDNDYPDGRYVMRREDLKTALLISDPLGSTDPKPDQWLVKDFFKPEKIKSIAFAALEATNSWTLAATNEGAPLTMLNCATNEIVDDAKISSLVATIQNPSFIDVATNAAPDITGMDTPETLTVETFTGVKYAIKIGKKTPEGNAYVQVSASGDLVKERTPGKDEKAEDKAKLDKAFDEKLKLAKDKLALEKSLDKWTFLISGYTTDALARPRRNLMQDKESAKPNDAAGIGKDEEKDDDKGPDFQDMKIMTPGK
jgi:hypothetical protein